VADVIDHVAARSCVDAHRVYATGFSGGGRMASLLGCRLNQRIAAIGPVGGLRWFGPCPGRAVPVITVHGTADLTNPYEGHADRGADWVESVAEALAGWAAHNHCQPKLVQEDPPGPAYTVRYAGCAAGADVRLTRIDGLGHTWPRGEIDATDMVWQFFKAHPLP
jgi:polyhydroxybutyrate depolymerase